MRTALDEAVRQLRGAGGETDASDALAEIAERFGRLHGEIVRLALGAPAAGPQAAERRTAK